MIIAISYETLAELDVFTGSQIFGKADGERDNLLHSQSNCDVNKSPNGFHIFSKQNKKKFLKL